MSEEVFTRWIDPTIEEKDKEIKRLNKCIKDDKENADEIIAEQQREIERLKQVEKEHQRINGELREENDIAKEKVKSAIKEIEKLNNIINEIQKDLEDRYYGRGKYSLSTDIVGIPTFLNRIKEIKGSDKHE